MKMGKRYKTKKEAQKRVTPGKVAIWRGKSISDNPGWYVVSQIRGRRK